MDYNDFEPPFRSGHWIAQILTVLLLAEALLYLIEFIFGLFQIELLVQVMGGRQSALAELNANYRISGAVALPAAVIRITTIVVFLFWVYRAHRNLTAMNAHDLDYSSGWALVLFFVPLVNLVSPYRIVREIWKGSTFATGTSDAPSWRSLKSSPMLVTWWTAFILTLLLTETALLLSPESSGDPFVFYAAGSWVTSYAAGLTAAVFALLIVREIDSSQRIGFLRRVQFDSPIPDQALPQVFLTAQHGHKPENRSDTETCQPGSTRDLADSPTPKRLISQDGTVAPATALRISMVFESESTSHNSFTPRARYVSALVVLS